MDQKRDVIIVVVAAMLCSLSLAFANETMASFTRAPYVPSVCFNETDKGTLIVGIGDPLWNRELCGQKLKVTCVDGNSQNCKSSSVNVLIVDYCQGCRDSSINLSEEAFDVIANKDAGLVKVKYVYVSG